MAHSILEVFPCFPTLYVFCFSLRHMKIMRFCALYLLLLFAHCSVCQIEKPQLSHNKQQNATAAEQISQNLNLSPTGNTQLANPPSKQGADQSGSYSNLEAANNRITWFTGALVLFSALQFVAMLMQYHAMNSQAQYTQKGLRVSIRSARAAQRSARAARDAADAALRNAEAVVNSERPWVVVEFLEDGGKYKVVATNYGRTPAQIVGISIQHSSTMKLSEISKPSDYDPTSWQGEQPFLIPDDDWEVTKISVYGPSKNPSSAPILPVICWGVLRYRSAVTNAEHDTCFCQQFYGTMGRFILAGPPEYNRYT